MFKIILKKFLSFISFSLLNKLVSNSLIFNHYKRVLSIKTYDNRKKYLNKVSEKLNTLDNLIILEFGVYEGESLRIFSNNISNPNTTFYGFDTFTGLPEKWFHFEKGHFNTNGSVPNISDPRVFYEIGLFEQTLPKFLENLKKKSRLNSNFFIHFDADLFSSTLYVLNKLNSYLNEYYFSFDEFPSDEVRALYTHEKLNKCKIEFLFKQKKNLSIPVARVFGKISNK